MEDTWNYLRGIFDHTWWLLLRALESVALFSIRALLRVEDWAIERQLDIQERYDGEGRPGTEWVSAIARLFEQGDATTTFSEAFHERAMNPPQPKRTARQRVEDAGFFPNGAIEPLDLSKLP